MRYRDDLEFIDANGEMNDVLESLDIRQTQVNFPRGKFAFPKPMRILLNLCQYLVDCSPELRPEPGAL